MLIEVEMFGDGLIYINTDCVTVLDRYLNTMVMADGTKYNLPTRSFDKLLKVMKGANRSEEEGLS